MSRRIAAIVWLAILAFLASHMKASAQQPYCVVRERGQCLQVREDSRFDRESAITRGDVDRRQVDRILRQWQGERSRGGFPCLPHEARCRE